MNDEQREVVDHLFEVFESDAGYWFRGERTCDDPERHGDRFYRCTACRWDGSDPDDETGAPLTITFLTLLDGLKVMAASPRDRWWDKGWPTLAKNTILALNGTPSDDEDDQWDDSDANWGDAVGQLGLLGDIVYD